VTRYIIRRLLFVPPLLVLGSILVFVLLRVVPGDPVAAMLGTEATPAQVAALRQQLGLSDPLPAQYVRWIGDVSTGSLGRSIVNSQPIGASIRKRLPVTLEVLVLALVFGTVIGISMGLLAALFRNSWLDYLLSLFSVLGLSVPAFFTLTLLILLPSLWWNYVPPLGYVSPFADPWKNARIFLPPTLILSIEGSAGLMRYTRTVCLDVLRQDYMRTATAKGLAQRLILRRHMARNAMVPIITILGGRVAVLLGGSVILEQVMNLAGLGQYTLQAVQSRDYPVVQAMTLYIGAVVVLANLFVDISYGYFDPRIRYR
jgi:peptide/nickel transport system permease protein